jgi:hypothetical protein
MVHLAEVARRVVALGYVPSMTGGRVGKLAATDPDWPITSAQEQRAGNRRLVPWDPVRDYFASRFAGRGSRPGPKGWARRKTEPKSTEPPSRRSIPAGRKPAPAAGRRIQQVPSRSSRNSLPIRANEAPQRSNRWAKAEWVTLAEVARRAVTELGYPSMSRQAVWELANTDQDWPVDRAQWRQVGRYWQVPWPPVRYYLAKRKGRGALGKPWLHRHPRRSAVELVTLAEAARRAVTELGYPSMSGQTLGKLARTDPDWPVDRAQWQRVGPYWQVPWPTVRDYLANRDTRPGPKGRPRSRRHPAAAPRRRQRQTGPTGEPRARGPARVRQREGLPSRRRPG